MEENELYPYQYRPEKDTPSQLHGSVEEEPEAQKHGDFGNDPECPAPHWH